MRPNSLAAAPLFTAFLWSALPAQLAQTHGQCANSLKDAVYQQQLGVFYAHKMLHVRTCITDAACQYRRIPLQTSLGCPGCGLRDQSPACPYNCPKLHVGV